MPKPKIDFHIWYSRVTDGVLDTDAGGRFPTLDEAEAEIQAHGREWHGACIYEIETVYDYGDPLGPIPVEAERVVRNYVEGDDGRFVLDEVITAEV